MSQPEINLGAAANDGTGDALRVAGAKINSGFSEVYGCLFGLGAAGALVARVDQIKVRAESTTPLALQILASDGSAAQVEAGVFTGTKFSAPLLRIAPGSPPVPESNCIYSDGAFLIWRDASGADHTLAPI